MHVYRDRMLLIYRPIDMQTICWPLDKHPTMLPHAEGSTAGKQMRALKAHAQAPCPQRLRFVGRLVDWVDGGLFELCYM